MVKLQRALPRAQFLGVELSEHGVEISRRKAPGATFLVADLFHPPTELARYKDWGTDAVCSEVLEHVDDPAGLLRATRVYLADGARLIVTVPGGPMSAFDRHIGHRQHFTRESIRQVLHDAGFVAERVCLAGFPFFNLYRLMVIARGERLSSDVDATQRGATAALANAMMAIFRGLLRITLLDSPFGWQVVAIARKRPVGTATQPTSASTHPIHQ